MKGSAWYNRLWRSKLNQVSLKEDADSAWTSMKSLLDQQLPAGNLPKGPVKPTGFTSLKFMAYVITAATVITPVAYVALHHKNIPTHVVERKAKKPASKIDTVQANDQKDSLSASNLTTGTNNQSVLNSEADDRDTAYTPHTQGQGSPATTTVLVPGDKSTNGLGDNDRNSTEKVDALTTPAKTKPRDNVSDTPDPASVNNSKSGIHPTTNRVDASTATLANKMASVTTSKAAERQSNNGSNARNVKVKESSNGSNRINGYSPAEQPAGGLQQYGYHGNRRLWQPQGRAAELQAASMLYTDRSTPVLNFENQLPVANNLSYPVKTRSYKPNRTLRKVGKPVKNKAPKFNTAKPLNSPAFNYGVWAGAGLGNVKGIYLGAFGSYKIKGRLLIETGVKLNSLSAISQQYTHASYYKPDSLPAFTLTDKRKLLLLDVPLNFSYCISSFVSIKAGPVISLPLKQSGISYQFSPIADRRDTSRYGRTIDSTLRHTTSKVSLGFSGGVEFNIRRLGIGVSYQALRPYQLSNDFGTLKKSNKSIQLDVSYRFR